MRRLAEFLVKVYDLLFDRTTVPIWIWALACAVLVLSALNGAYLHAVEREVAKSEKSEKVLTEQLVEMSELVLKYQAQANRFRVVTVTAYMPVKEQTDSTPDRGAVQRKVVPGRTMAVSRDLIYMLGCEAYIEGFGNWIANDVMAEEVDGVPVRETVDLCVPNVAAAEKIGHVHGKQLVILVCGGMK